MVVFTPIFSPNAQRSGHSIEGIAPSSSAVIASRPTSTASTPAITAAISAAIGSAR